MKRWMAMLAAMLLGWTWTAAGEGKTMAEQTANYADGSLAGFGSWYGEALKDSVMSRGNNARLKQVIGKLRRGEPVTLAVIGGSITEGAGAASYQECWASRLYVRFKTEYAAESGAGVFLVNAGVGGTNSPFGYMRYRRDIVNRVPARDPDGLPDLVVIEFSVNDWEEPTGHRCYESMVKEILDSPNEPAVILLFAVFRNGFNLQDDLKRIGERYGLMMVSIKDAFYAHFGKELTKEGFFADEYHPTSLGHRMMTDCLMQAIGEAAGAETDEKPEPEAQPVYGTDFTGLQTIFGDTPAEGFTVDRGGFRSSDAHSYHNKPVGWVCGENFFHDADDPEEPMRITGVFRKCLVAWKASDDPAFGAAEIFVDGRLVKKVRGGEGKWGQSEVALVLDEREAAEHTLEIRAEAGKKFTVTAVGLQ